MLGRDDLSQTSLPLHHLEKVIEETKKQETKYLPSAIANGPPYLQGRNVQWRWDGLATMPTKGMETLAV
jgi:hypothetical protein